MDTTLTAVNDNEKSDDDLTRPIARSGEQQFAAIMRNRSGMDAGNIDYGLRVFAVENLGDGEKQDICDTAFALYQNICQYAGLRAKNDKGRP